MRHPIALVLIGRFLLKHLLQDIQNAGDGSALDAEVGQILRSETKLSDV